MQQVIQVSSRLEENETYFRRELKDCADVVFRKFHLGVQPSVEALAVFTEPTTQNLQFSDSALGKMLSMLVEEEGSRVLSRVREKKLGMLDVEELEDLPQSIQGFLSGDVILFLDGYNKALKIPNKGYPGLGVTQAETEKGLRGSDESFSDSVKTNVSLLRKRIRSSQLKVREYHVGTRSNTLTYLVYMEGIVAPDILKHIEEKLDAYRIDRILDSGTEQQLIMEQSWSPFPQIQSTRRPSFAAEELMEGRAVLIFDNSPEVLLLPSAFQDFLTAADDNFLNYQIVSLIRGLRYMACFFAMTFPGLYIVACSYENMMLPTDLLLAVQRAAQGNPFSAPVEILMMEVSFELLREAGVRMPGDMGNAIGIVGGLIIGSAAVDASLVSPIVVIVVAFTALCSFSIPSEELTQSFRVLKFGFILLCALAGPVGMVVGLLAVTLHLSTLTSLGRPFLSKVHSTFQVPTRQKQYRGVYGFSQNPVRLKRTKKG
ncbi:MAG: spore germination protein [Lachnospiraceae bacterium]